jgi:hypothetical protein
MPRLISALLGRPQKGTHLFQMGQCYRRKSKKIFFTSCSFCLRIDFVFFFKKFSGRRDVVNERKNRLFAILSSPKIKTANTKRVGR